MCPLRRYRTLYLLSRMCPVKSTTRTPHCFLLFQYISIIYLWTIFIQKFRHENHSVDSAFLTELFIWTNKDPNFVPSGHSVGIPYAFCRRSSILVLKTLRHSSHLSHSSHSCTWGTWVLGYSRYLRAWDTFFSTFNTFFSVTRNEC